MSIWSRALQIVLGLASAGAAAGLALSTALIVIDQTDHTDDWDGFGTLIGVYGGVFATLALLVALGLFAFVRSGRRNGSSAQLIVAAGLAAFVALPLLGSGLFVADASGTAVALAVTIGALALLVPACGTIIAASSRPPAHAEHPGPH
ncbi:hypothetical protein [Aeromicrobium sp.]|uniref:hypothetical protein n=1 Tax=Aeromicrobium sp. TaxID=1871063 RepID=UPI0028B02FCE|nr:hypothetical protein [Aeromicrobium sp.]